MVQAAVSIPPGGSPRLHAPREAERGVLHQVLRRHLPAFLEATSGDEGRGVPSFVRRELRGFLRCGVLRHGFARLRCGTCREEKLVPFSCKGRGFCPCCGGRRMAERAAHLVDEVFPRAPVRQWVLSLPYALRYRLAYDHELCRAVLKVYVRALLGFHRRRARRLGVEAGQGGSVTVIQRFGAGLRLNLHFHTTAIDGVFTPSSDGESADGEGVVFTELPAPTDEEVATLLRTVVRRIHRLLVRRGLIDTEEGDPPSAPADPATTEAPALATLQQASLRGVQALGAEAGQRVRRVRDPLHAHRAHARHRPMHARLDGFDLHAAVAVAADDREGLESLCRYIARPAVAQTSLELLDEDRVRVALRHPWRDGTTHLEFEPLELIGRLAAFVPRPRTNLTLYHGVLAPNARLRADVVAYGRDTESTTVPSPSNSAEEAATKGPPACGLWIWANLMRRTFAIDVLACTTCGGRLELVSVITCPATAASIAAHLRRHRYPPRGSPRRSFC